MAGDIDVAEAASKGDWERVEKLVKRGDNVNFIEEFGRTALHYAAERGNRAICALLLKSGANINAIAWNMFGDQPLHSAARRNQAAVCELLVAHGADVTVRNERGKTPLMLAVGNELKEFSACHSLISNDSVNVPDGDGNYPLHIAVRQGDIETVQLLVNYGAYTNVVAGYSGQTPLHAAAGGSNDCPELCEILLKHRAEINARDVDGNRPLHMACKRGHARTVELMMSHGADTSAENKYRQTPLHIAADGWNDCPEICEILLKHHSEINARDVDGNRPLHMACKRGHARTVELMMSHGADTSAENKYRQTPLHIAADGWNDCPEICEILLKHHSEINARDVDGNRPLHMACKRGHARTVELMMSHGADTSAENKYRQTPLHIAADGWNDCPEICEILLKHHSEINARDVDGNRPLHIACKRGHAKTVELMVFKGADTHAVNKHGQTPLHTAANREIDCPKLCEILLKHDAKIDAVDVDGSQPLHLACKHGHTKTVNLLLSHRADVRAISDHGHSPLLLISKHITGSQRGVDSEGNHALHITSRRGMSTTVQVLVDLGADTNAVNKHGQTPLHMAAGGENDCPELCEILLKHDAKIDAVDVNGSQPLHLACRQGHTKTVNLLLSHRADVRAINDHGHSPLLLISKHITGSQRGVDSEGNHPLHITSRRGMSTTVQVLVDLGADTNAVNKRGQTPLHIAASGEKDCLELCEILLKHDAKTDAADVNESQPLHLACKQHHAETVKLLLSYGADTNAVNKCGQTPLHTAASRQSDCPELCEILLKHDAEIDAVDVDGSQQLHLACKQGHAETVKLLLSYGADTNAVNKCGQTPLHTAASRQSDCPELCEILLKHDAKIDAVDVNGSQPLHLACKQGHTKIVNLLLSHSADVRAIDDSGHSPLLLMSKHITGSKRGANNEGNHALHIKGMSTTIQLLVDLGADTNAVNKHGQTPLHIAAGGEKECLELCEILLKHGAKINAVDKDENQPLHLACKRGHVKSGKLLVSHGADLEAVNKAEESVLHMVAMSPNDCLDLCHCIMKGGASPNIHNNNGKLPCEVALRSGNLQAFQFLLTNSAICKSADLTDVDRTYTCSNMLLVAIQMGIVDICRQLLEHGASANTTLDDGTHCLELTLTGKKQEILRLLLLHGADIFGALSRMSVKSRATAESMRQKALVQAACRIQ